MCHNNKEKLSIKKFFVLQFLFCYTFEIVLKKNIPLGLKHFLDFLKVFQKIFFFTISTKL